MYHKIMAKMPPWVHRLMAWCKSVRITFNVRIKMESGSYSAVRFQHPFPWGAWHGMEFNHECGGKLLRFKVVNFAPATRVMLVERVFKDKEEKANKK